MRAIRARAWRGAVPISRRSRAGSSRTRRGSPSRAAPEGRGKRSSARGSDVDRLVEKWYSELYSFLGLDVLGVAEDLGRSIVRDVLNLLYGESQSSPTLDSVIRKIKRYSEAVNVLISSKLLDEVGSLNDQQLEFVVVSGGRAAAERVSELYKLVKSRNRSDLLSYLERSWEKHGSPTPVRCPKCGFRAVMPDLSCYVCGHVVTEDHVRGELGFEDKLRVYVEQASVAELRDVMNLGFVLLSSDGVYSPRLGRGQTSERKVYFQIHLKSSDYSLISSAISSRELEV